MAVKRKGLGKGLDALIGPKKTIERSVEKEKTTENDKAGPGKDNAEEIKQDNILIPDSNVLKESTTEKKKQNEKQNDAADEEAGMKKELPRDSFTAAKIVKLSLVEPNRNQPRKSFDEDSLIAQLKAKNEEYKLQYKYHQMILNRQLPYTIGGGIGESRLCMLLMGKAHIGEVQSSIWDDETLDY